MPFRSEAQRRKFYVMAREGEISRKTVEEWEEATKKHKKKLPKKVQKSDTKFTLKKGMNDEYGTYGVEAPGAAGPRVNTQSMPDFRIYYSPESQEREEREQEQEELRVSTIRGKERGFWGAPPRDPQIRYDGEELSSHVQRGPRLVVSRPTHIGPKKRPVQGNQPDESDEEEDSKKKRRSRKLVVRRK